MRKYAFYAAEKAGKLDQVKARAIEERIRERYSVSDEFGILRQRDRKPEEFAEYDAFVEQVKADVAAEIAKSLEEGKLRAEERALS
jgi:hypothetical protein